jgi:hypothetical protein
MWAALAAEGTRHRRARPGHPREAAGGDAVDARHKAGHDALSEFRRYIVTPTVAKHRLFVWTELAVCPDPGAQPRKGEDAGGVSRRRPRPCAKQMLAKNRIVCYQYSTGRNRTRAGPTLEARTREETVERRLRGFAHNLRGESGSRKISVFFSAVTH